MPERRTTRETSSSQSAPPVPGSAASEFATVGVLDAPGADGYLERFLFHRAIERSIEGRAQLVDLDDDDDDDDDDEDDLDDDDLDFDDDDLDDDDDDDGDPLCPECDADLELGEEHEPDCSYGPGGENFVEDDSVE